MKHILDFQKYVKRKCSFYHPLIGSSNKQKVVQCFLSDLTILLLKKRGTERGVFIGVSNMAMVASEMVLVIFVILFHSS